MKKLFTIIAATFVFCAGAQPVFQYSNSVNVSAGVTGTISAGSKPSSPGPSGAGVTWNFSALTFTPMGSVSIVSPTATPYASSFPSANWAAVISGTAIGTMYVYNNVQPTFQDQIGNGITAVGGQTYTPDPKRHLIFPFNYTNSYTDSYQCVSCSPGNFTITYDAYGTLIINGKTYNNVARVANLFGFNYYNYYNTNPIYSIFSYDSSPTSGNTSTYFDMPGVAAGIEESFIVKHMDVYPNPANDVVTIKNNNFMKVEFEIHDLLGKTVKTKELLNQGETAKVDISSYPAGMYLLKYNDEFGNTAFAKIIVE